MKRTNNFRYLLGLALSAVMLSSIVIAGCGGGSSDDDSAATTNAANKPAKDDVETP